jgi:hypothetical protein
MARDHFVNLSFRQLVPSSNVVNEPSCVRRGQFTLIGLNAATQPALNKHNFKRFKYYI